VKQLRFSQLSPQRQALIRLCQAINHGSIEYLVVKDCQPVLDPPPVALKDVKLDSDEGPRPELALDDFVVSDQIGRLLSHLDRMDCGAIRHIEIRTGIPRRIRVESQEFKASELGKLVAPGELRNHQETLALRAPGHLGAFAGRFANWSGELRLLRRVERDGAVPQLAVVLRRRVLAGGPRRGSVTHIGQRASENQNELKPCQGCVTPFRLTSVTTAPLSRKHLVSCLDPGKDGGSGIRCPSTFCK
jgi:hypothetical protein